MANQQRTGDAKEAWKVEGFRGINELVDDVDLPRQSVPYARGGYFNETLDFVRIPGKLLPSSASSGGVVLGLVQLTFTDSNVLVVHQGNNYTAIEDVSVLLDQEEATDNPLVPTVF